MPTKYYDRRLRSNNRDYIRTEVMNWIIDDSRELIDDNPYTKAVYTVEYFNGYTIELHRSGKNNGFYFDIHINIFRFDKRGDSTIPSIDDIIGIFKEVQRFSEMFNNDYYNKKIKPIVNDIYNCKEVNFNPESIGTIFDVSGHSRPIEIILLALKWVFIKEDIFYWMSDGRERLYLKLKHNDMI